MDGSIFVAAAVAAMIYFAGVGAVDGVKYVAHKVHAGVEWVAHHAKPGHKSVG